MDKRHKIYTALIVGLLLLYVLKAVNIDIFAIPTGGAVDEKTMELKQLKADLGLKRQEKQKLLEDQAHFKAFLGTLWIKKDSSTLQNDIQSYVLALSQQYGVELKYVGAPRQMAVSKNVEAIDITISSHSNTRDLSLFIAAIDNCPKSLVWQQCSMRPDNYSSPSQVILNGRIRAYVISPRLKRTLDMN